MKISVVLSPALGWWAKLKIKSPKVSTFFQLFPRSTVITLNITSSAQLIFSLYSVLRMANGESICLGFLFAESFFMFNIHSSTYSYVYFMEYYSVSWRYKNCYSLDDGWMLFQLLDSLFIYSFHYSFYRLSESTYFSIIHQLLSVFIAILYVPLFCAFSLCDLKFCFIVRKCGFCLLKSSTSIVVAN